MRAIIGLAFIASFCGAADRYVVQVNDAGETIPAHTIATPAQVTALGESADAAAATAEDAYGPATNAAAVAQLALQRTSLFSSNYVVTSTVYVQSIGGVPYDASNQLIRVQSVSVSPTNVAIVATVKQTPLITPVLDWRAALNSGAWSNVTAEVSGTDIPAGVTNAAAAYLFVLPRPDGSGAFFRVVDNSTGASGSGLYWLVYGGITVDGHRGANMTLTNIVEAVTNTYRVVGGIIVEENPL